MIREYGDWIVNTYRNLLESDPDVGENPEAVMGPVSRVPGEQ